MWTALVMEKITDKIAALPGDANYFSLEFFPPKTPMGSVNLRGRLERMSRALRPLFVNVTWGAGGSTAAKSLELAEICQRQLGLTTCLHLTCTNMNKSLVDEALDDAKALGIRNIMALRGDPPRNDEYGEEPMGHPPDDMEFTFTWAADLVRYIRKRHGDYFCVGVAAYPEGHADESYPEIQSPLHDMPYLVEKTKAGADFVMTQLFFDVKAYLDFEKLLRTHPSEVFKSIPIIPGLMPVQSYSILKRTTKLSHAKIPEEILARLEAVKGDDEAVKSVGVDILGEIVEKIKDTQSPGPRGFHFYTLNLEKAVAFILERCDLIPPSTPASRSLIDSAAVEDIDDHLLPGGVNGVNNEVRMAIRRRLSSVNSDPHNLVIVDNLAGSRARAFEAPADEAGIPKDSVNTRANTLAISEGQGSLGREATWDDYPNGRWGDARSPAYGEIDGYGVSLHASVSQAIKLWGHPTQREDIANIFLSHLAGELEAIPWSEEGLNEETASIRSELLQLNRRGWWTVASQPAVNGIRSDDRIYGWGPKNGFVFQKPFVEFFIPSSEWEGLRQKLATNDDITFYAGNSEGSSDSNNADAVDAVTWGAFPGKEIVTPTIIEEISFKAWLEEAFSIWSEWQRVYPPQSPTAKLLREVKEDVWLVSIIHHAYIEKDALWKLLLEH
ncbi:hypothetical protein FGG08_003771 [Glutinoglossum americanum]|uniref:MTHFR SAM-binding regulatory domain-containing protein n=1 Tax=Glutinoglossum americanum TaxID=1670608 RepID=A0A9P8KXQ7_9PEZI|nr:hypothetical protein FGG08_003771 [Glutinoglossum americanum]